MKRVSENFIASDVMALAPVTNKFIYLEDGQIAVIKNKDVLVKNMKNQKVKHKHMKLIQIHGSDLAGYNHFMEKILNNLKLLKIDSECLTKHESKKGFSAQVLNRLKKYF